RKQGHDCGFADRRIRWGGGRRACSAQDYDCAQRREHRFESFHGNELPDCAGVVEPLNYKTLGIEVLFVLAAERPWASLSTGPEHAGATFRFSGPARSRGAATNRSQAEAPDLGHQLPIISIEGLIFVRRLESAFSQRAAPRNPSFRGSSNGGFWSRK